MKKYKAYIYFAAIMTAGIAIFSSMIYVLMILAYILETW